MIKSLQYIVKIIIEANILYNHRMITPPSEAVKIVKTFLDDDREQLIMYPSKIIQFQYKS
jgi:hypothetical protein